MLKIYGVTFTNCYKYVMTKDRPKTLFQIADTITFIFYDYFATYY